jgi:p-aminobenzoyl-glutamate transporter AbgT
MKEEKKRIPIIGSLVESLLVCLPFLGVINFVFISIAMYASVLPYIQPILPFMTLWVFMLTLFIIVILAMWLINKWVIPALWDYRGKKMLNKESDVIKRLKRIEKALNIQEDND